MNPNRKQRPELKKNSQIYEMLYVVNAMAEAGDYASRTRRIYSVINILVLRIRNLQDTKLTMLLSIFTSDYNFLNIMP